VREKLSLREWVYAYMNNFSEAYKKKILEINTRYKIKIYGTTKQNRLLKILRRLSIINIEHMMKFTDYSNHYRFVNNMMRLGYGLEAKNLQY